ncbi:alkaline lipase [Pseudoalteromonas sp. SW0106-04]|uniref:alpha/beta fold hydrolase n=1 Tax=Pseudoalteromonas sp. SW0106-04 TaxID=1702169 RepID=UPI0006C41743|nr:alpha/beta fold hydrolase [Pseudoalteromonas sp. SW0106-04]GAP74781.1 alkaline lipase [Pseudoalteromonas sp. SW0106-04]
MKHIFVAIALLVGVSPSAWAQCRDNVVLVHGNTSSPSSWNNTREQLYAQGYTDTQIFAPNWGSKTCASCNDHNGSEELPVREAILDAINQSCSGKIDIIGHSMGVTLAAQQVYKLGLSADVDAFVGIAGALRGLLSCGVYPYNVWNSTCGYHGLSVSSPFLDGLYGQQFANRVYSIKSYADQVVCATGSCYVYGIHSSRIWHETATFTYALGHFGLQTDTAAKQVSLIQ